MSDPEFFQLRCIDTWRRNFHELAPLDFPNHHPGDHQGLQTGGFFACGHAHPCKISVLSIVLSEGFILTSLELESTLQKRTTPHIRINNCTSYIVVICH